MILLSKQQKRFHGRLIEGTVSLALCKYADILFSNIEMLGVLRDSWE